MSTKVGRLLRPDPGWHPFRKMFVDAAPFRPDYDYSYDGVMRPHEEGATYNYEPPPPEIFARTRAIEGVCRSHGVPLAAAALRFPLTHPSVASVIPGMASLDRLNRDVASMKQVVPASLWSGLKARGLLRADAPVPTEASSA